METTVLKGRVTKLIDEVAELAEDVKSALGDSQTDGSTEMNIQMITMILMQGVLTTILSGLQNAYKVLDIADIHERTRGTGKVTSLNV